MKTETSSLQNFPVKRTMLLIIGALCLLVMLGLKKKTVILFIGPPASGKTTAAKWCKKNKNWGYLSTEHLCLDLAKSGTSLGKKIEPYVTTGQLVPDSLLLPMVKKELERSFETVDHIILESFPRTIPQAEALKKMLEETFGPTNFVVIDFQASDKVIKKRIESRFICSNCKKSYILHRGSPLVPQKEMICDKCDGKLTKKADDKQQLLEKRIALFRKYQKPLLDFYKKADIKIASYTIELDVNNPLEKQFKEIANMIA